MGKLWKKVKQRGKRDKKNKIPPRVWTMTGVETFKTNRVQSWSDSELGGQRRTRSSSSYEYAESDYEEHQPIKSSPQEEEEWVNVASDVPKYRSLLTPDMLEAVGLTEMNVANHHFLYEDQIRDASYINTSPIGSPTTVNVPSRKKKKKRNSTSKKKKQRRSFTSKSSNCSKERKISFGDGGCLSYFADNDTKTSSGDTISTESTYSDEESYENLVSPSRDEDGSTMDEGSWQQHRSNTNPCTTCYQDNFDTPSFHCDPMASANFVLTMPFTCGLLCFDNIFDTKLFDAATASYKPRRLKELRKPKKNYQRTYQQDTVDDDNDDEEEGWYTSVCDILPSFSEDNHHNHSRIPCLAV